MSTAPLITFRQAVSPYAVLASIPYIQTTPYGSTLPVLSSNDSDPLLFRIYNNYSSVSGIANALNVTLACYDGVGVHTASMPVASQRWIHVMENGFGESVSAPGLYTVLKGTDTSIGGTNVYTFENGSSGSTSSQIRAGSSNNGCGFLEVKSYARVPDGATPGTASFALSVLYDWFT